MFKICTICGDKIVRNYYYVPVQEAHTHHSTKMDFIMNSLPRLVLGRKIGEVIEISVPDSSGTETLIYLDISSISSNQVKIGITAPTDVLVLRSEIIRDHHNEN